MFCCNLKNYYEKKHFLLFDSMIHTEIIDISYNLK